MKESMQSIKSIRSMESHITSYMKTEVKNIVKKIVKSIDRGVEGLNGKQFLALLVFASLVLACPGKSNVGTNTMAYVCANGTVNEGTATVPNLNSCASCSEGFELVQNTCVASGDVSFVCENGTALSSKTGATAANICESCNDGYTLLPKVDSCLEGFAFVCAGGEPVVGIAATANMNNCATCDTGTVSATKTCMDNTPPPVAVARAATTELLITEIQATNTRDVGSTAPCTRADDGTTSMGCRSAFIEIYNNTGADVDLSNYALLYANNPGNSDNGKSTWTDFDTDCSDGCDRLALTGMLANDDFLSRFPPRCRYGKHHP